MNNSDRSGRSSAEGVTLRRRTALAQMAGAAAAALVATRVPGSPASAGGTTTPVLRPSEGTTVSINVATGRTHLQNPNAAATLSLQNTSASTSSSRSALYAYVGTASTLPAADRSAAVRGVNDSGLDGSAGVVGVADAEEATGVFGQSASGTGIVGRTTAGTGVLAIGSGPGAVALSVNGPTATAGDVDVDGSLRVTGPGGFDGPVSMSNELNVSGVIKTTATDPGDLGMVVSGLGTSFLSNHGAPRASRLGTPRPSVAAFAADVAGDVFGVDLDMQDAQGTGLRIRTTGGPAIDVQGASTFEGGVELDRLAGLPGTLPAFENSGIATIPAGKAAVRVVDSRVTPRAMVIATIQNNPGRGVVLQHVTPLRGKFNIRLARRAPKDVRIAYLLLGPP